LQLFPHGGDKHGSSPTRRIMRRYEFHGALPSPSRKIHPGQRRAVIGIRE
jgi:hypothetical protein